MTDDELALELEALETDLQIGGIGEKTRCEQTRFELIRFLVPLTDQEEFDARKAQLLQHTRGASRSHHSVTETGFSCKAPWDQQQCSSRGSCLLLKEFAPTGATRAARPWSIPPHKNHHVRRGQDSGS